MLCCCASWTMRKLLCRKMLSVTLPLMAAAVATLSPWKMHVAGWRMHLPRQAGFAAHQHRSWVKVPSRGSPSTSTSEISSHAANNVRILSYNVLGPRYRPHPEFPFSTWPKRSENLQQEIREYHELADNGLHAICLQEVTPQNLHDTWIPFMKDLGLDGYVYKAKRSGDSDSREYKCYGVVIFYNTTLLEVTREMRVFFANEVQQLREQKRNRQYECFRSTPLPDTPGKRSQVTTDERMREDMPTIDRVTTGSIMPTRSREKYDEPCDDSEYVAISYLEDDLRKTKDAAVIVRLRLRNPESEGSKNRETSTSDVELGRCHTSFTLVCCHLRFDPMRPDLKTAQCKLLFDAIHRFHQECGVSPGQTRDIAQSEMQRFSTSDEATTRHTACSRDAAEAINLIMCGDFNSVPLVQPGYLPQSLQPAAIAALSGEGMAYSGTGDIHHSPIYPFSEDSASGVYSLLAFGRIPPTHPEHPDSFIPSFLARDVSTMCKKWDRRRRRLRKQKLKSREASHLRYGEWSSGYENSLEDVYRDRGHASPRFTTKTRSFAGVIDHIFASTGEPGGLAVRSVLGFPPGANMESQGTTDAEGGTIEASRKQHKKVLTGKEASRDGAVVEFGPIPAGIWGSDHLALGVEIALSQR